jgi:hypothetical protein
MLERIVDDVWAYGSPVRFYGIPLRARTTIVRLASGGLFVHSPGELNDNVRAAIEPLGDVRALIAPNTFHHVFLNAWRTTYPDASVHVPPQLAHGDVLTEHARDTVRESWSWLLR